MKIVTTSKKININDIIKLGKVEIKILYLGD